jgi:hypothetical protein
MRRFRITALTAVAIGLMLGTGTTVLGQGAQGHQPQMQQAPAQQGMGPSTMGQMPGMMGQGMGPGTMGQTPGMMGQGMGPGTMGQTPGMMGQGMGPGTMGQMPGMMGQGMGPGTMGQMPGMMGQGMGPGTMGQMPGMMGQGMGPGTMGQMPGMMRQGMGPGTMGQTPGMMGQGMGGWSGLAGRQVVPMIQLSTSDVRGFFEHQLAALGNERLKVGKVEALDDDTIAAEVVTLDDSLVESFEVDRHTGLISPAG